MYGKIKLIHKNIRKWDEIDYPTKDKFLVKSMGLAESP